MLYGYGGERDLRFECCDNRDEGKGMIDELTFVVDFSGWVIN